MGDIKEERLQEEIQKQRNIPLILESYNDIFSDFDPRSFSERALSDDFLIECKRAVRDKEGSLELVLSMPRNLRIVADETKIKKRLKEHFKKHANEKAKEIASIKKEGLIWIIAGSFLMLISALLETYTRNFWLNLIFVIMSPAGWFSFWIGGEKLVYEARNKKPDYEFYQKMSNVQITFRSY